MRKKLITMWLGVLMTVCATAQTEAYLHGKIITAGTRQPLEGVSIKIKSTKQSTVTDKYGEFKLSSTASADTLVASHVGYITISIAIKSGTAIPLTLAMENDQHELGSVDVVQTGYQAIAKERATGSFEKVNNQQLNQLAGTSIMARLEGVSGILFDKNGTRPAISVRGYSSIESSNAPLVIVDNFPYEGDINNINPNDVEDVTILKDAAAASIWGTRASNGVIVINTKKGKLKQSLKVGLNSNVTSMQQTDLFYKKLMYSSDYIDVEQYLYNKGYYNSQLASTSRPAVSPVVELLAQQAAGRITSTEATAQINAFRDIDLRNDLENYFYKTANYQQYALSASGGSATASWLMSAGYDRNLDQLSTGYNRLTLNLQNMFRPVKQLDITTGFTYTSSNSKAGQSPYSIFSGLYPYAKLVDGSGNALAVNKGYRKAYTDTAGAGKLLDWNYYPLTDYLHSENTTAVQDLLFNITTKYRITDWLDFDVRYQYERQQSNIRNYRDTGNYYVRNLINAFSQLNRSTGVVRYIVPNGGMADLSNVNLESHKARAQINLNKTIGRNGIVALVGVEVSQAHAYSYSSNLYGYNPDLATITNVDYANQYPNFVSGSNTYVPSATQVSDKTNRFVSQFANVAYTYDKRYTVSGSARRDASNLFGVDANDRWQPLWSAGAAWDISNERFYTLNWLPYLKLRGTFGYSGNVNTLKSAVTTERYGSIAARYTNYTYATITQYANPDLRWETTRTINGGLDFATKGRVLSGSIDIYFKNGTNLFGVSPFDYTTGTPATINKNVADMTGNGAEISLNARIFDKSFKWNCSILANFTTTKVTQYYVTSTSGSAYVSNGTTIKAVVGKPLFSLLTYQWAGLDSVGNPRAILNGKASTDYTSITGTGTPVSSLVYGGQGTPSVYGNWTNVFQWKGFSLTANISYRLGYSFQKSSLNYTQLFAGQVQTADYSTRWQKPGDENLTNVPSLSYPAVSNRDAVYAYSSVLTRKADNIRLQYINLAYSLYKRPGLKLPFENAQLYVNMANLGILWKANKEGLDPDYDNAYPPMKNITVGIRADF